MVALNLWLISSCGIERCTASIIEIRMKKHNCRDAQIIIICVVVRTTSHAPAMGEWKDRGVEAKILLMLETTDPNILRRQTITRYIRRAVGADARVCHNDHAGIVGPSIDFYDRRRQCTIYWYCTPHSRNWWTKQRTSTRLSALREQHASVVS